MYACPNCGGGLRFDIPSQELKCDYCSSQLDPYAVSKEKDADTDVDFGVTVFRCPQCGGEIMTTDESITGFCTFCGAATMLDSRMSKERRPKKIITFKKTKEDCKQIYARMAKGAIFAPKELKDPQYLEKFRGIYIPYWAYDISYNSDVSVNGTITHNGLTYTEIKTYKITFGLDASYSGVLYDASASFDDHISETIAPFQSKNMQDFTPSFLCGFYADTADVDKEVYRNDAIAAAENNISADIISDPFFSPYQCDGITGALKGKGNVNSELDEPDMALLPVWFLSYRTKENRMAYAVVNAESGEISADLPVDVKKYIVGSLITAAPIFLLLNFLFTPKPVYALGVTAVFAVISLIVYFSEINEINKKHLRYDDKGFYAKYGSASEDEEKKSIHAGRGAIGSILGIIIAIVVIIMNPVDDAVPYIASIAAIVGVCLTLIAIIRRFNILTTRPFPTFLDRKGGNDSAKDG